MSEKKSKTKKLSRRQMVVLLGTGGVFAGTGIGTGDRVEAKAGPCNAVKPSRGTGKGQQLVLMADPCCQEGLKIFRKGFQNIKEKAIKEHLKEFDTALGANQGQLLEYCVMVWGLTEDERGALMETMRSRYQMK